jgi:hypothetical protein
VALFYCLVVAIVVKKCITASFNELVSMSRGILVVMLANDVEFHSRLHQYCWLAKADTDRSLADQQLNFCLSLSQGAPVDRTR